MACRAVAPWPWRRICSTWPRLPTPWGRRSRQLSREAWPTQAATRGAGELQSPWQARHDERLEPGNSRCIPRPSAKPRRRQRSVSLAVPSRRDLAGRHVNVLGVQDLHSGRGRAPHPSDPRPTGWWPSGIGADALPQGCCRSLLKGGGAGSCRNRCRPLAADAVVGQRTAANGTTGPPGWQEARMPGPAPGGRTGRGSPGPIG